MIRHKGRGVTIGEIWFDDALDTNGVDVLVFRQRSSPMDKGTWTDFPTIVTDLSEDADRIFSRIKRASRQEIRRCERDGLTIDHWYPADAAALTAFLEFYNAFAAVKGRPEISENDLRRYLGAGILALSRASLEGRALCWHAYLAQAGRARGLLSASGRFDDDSSIHRSAVGRANRFLHWRDMLFFKNAGLNVYDLGGWYPGTDDQALLKVNQFKEEFGGTTIRQFDCKMGITLKGKLYLLLQDLRARGLGSRKGAHPAPRENGR